MIGVIVTFVRDAIVHFVLTVIFLHMMNIPVLENVKAYPFTFIASSVTGCLIGTMGFHVGWNWYRSKRSEPEPKKALESEIQCDNAEDVGACKLVLVVRNDLKMGKGKIAAQCAHAAVMAHEQARKKQPLILKEWKDNGQAKIVVKIDDEKDMLRLAEEAKKAGLIASIVCDAGRTQIARGSKTVLAVGPGPEDLINNITGHLKLL